MVDRLICSRSLRSLAVAFGVAVALSVLCALVLAGRADAQPSCSQSGSTIACTFGYTGVAQTWTVPADVTTASFDVQGAQGGPAYRAGTRPVWGGEATADLALTPGATVTLVVGGQGGSPAACAGPAPAGSTAAPRAAPKTSEEAVSRAAAAAGGPPMCASVAVG